MAWKEVMDLNQLQQKIRFPCIVEGHKILFIWHKEQVHAIQSQCPHLKLPLAKGKITDNATIVCPFHKSEFDLSTGKSHCWSVSPPGIGPLLGKISKQKDLRIYPTRIENGMVSVHL